MKTDTKPARRYDLDWLRVFAVLVLVFFHSSEIFSIGWFHVKNIERSWFFSYLSAFIHVWHMPLFFLISGASTVFALEFRSARAYRNERFFRLLVPLFFGILILIPPQSYLENLQRLRFDGSFFEFYPHFFNGIYPDGNLHWGHLWFLFYLFVISLVSLRLFTRLTADRSNSWYLRFAGYFSVKRKIFLLALPLLTVEIPLRWLFPGFQTFFTDWANVLHYLLLFIFGYLLFSDARFSTAISRNKGLALLLALPTTIGFMAILPRAFTAFEGFAQTSTAAYILAHPEVIGYYVSMSILKVVGEWCWLIALLGYAGRWLSNRKGRGILYLSRIAMPFYIFHQTVIVVLAFYIVQTSLPIGLKYILTCLVSIPLILICCQLAISNRLTRLLFGIK